MSNLLGVAVLLNSALYLAAVIAAGLVTAHTAAWRLGIFAVGLTYLCYLALANYEHVARLLVVLSVVVGTAAGLALLF